MSDKIYYVKFTEGEIHQKQTVCDVTQPEFLIIPLNVFEM
jgi:hypothetical protein